MPLLVASHQIDDIDWNELDDWVISEGIVGNKEVLEFYKQIVRDLPS